MRNITVRNIEENKIEETKKILKGIGFNFQKINKIILEAGYKKIIAGDGVEFFQKIMEDAKND